MHHFETWEHGWHYVPVTLFLVMIIIMTVFFIYFYRKRGFFFNRRWFGQNWIRDWFLDYYRSRTGESASEMLKKRYIRGEINKEIFEQLKKDISFKD